MAKRKPFKKLRKTWKRWRPVLGRGVLILIGLLTLTPPLLVGVTAFNHSPLKTWRSILSGNEVQQEWRPLDTISPHLVHAVIAAEDSKFCVHGGFDWEAINAAWESNEAGSGKRGASTISMQTAKNVFLWPQRTWIRKGYEAYFTVLIEFLWSKEHILEAYLNVAEWGPNIFGAESAAQYHYAKPSSQLSRFEAAHLAAILPSPIKWKANPPGRYVSQRSAVLMRRMRVVANGHANCIR